MSDLRTKQALVGHVCRAGHVHPNLAYKQPDTTAPACHEVIVGGVYAWPEALLATNGAIASTNTNRDPS